MKLFNANIKLQLVLLQKKAKKNPSKLLKYLKGFLFNDRDIGRHRVNNYYVDSTGPKYILYK